MKNEGFAMPNMSHISADIIRYLTEKCLEYYPGQQEQVVNFARQPKKN